jgi:hypothetical protein
MPRIVARIEGPGREARPRGLATRQAELAASAAEEKVLSLARDAIGDILPVRLVNGSLRWHFALTAKIVALMGPEELRSLGSTGRPPRTFSPSCDEEYMGEALRGSVVIYS